MKYASLVVFSANLLLYIVDCNSPNPSKSIRRLDGFRSIGERQTWVQRYSLESCCCVNAENKNSLINNIKVINLQEGLRFGTIISTSECGKIRKRDLYCNFRVTVPDIDNYGIGHELKCKGFPSSKYSSIDNDSTIRNWYNNKGNNVQKSTVECDGKSKQKFTLETKNQINSNSFGYEILIKNGSVVGFEASFTMLGLLFNSEQSKENKDSPRTRCSLRTLPGETQSCGQNSRYCIPTAFECNGFDECPMNSKQNTSYSLKSHDENNDSCPRELRTSGSRSKEDGDSYRRLGEGRSIEGPISSLFNEDKSIDRRRLRLKGTKLVPGERDRDHQKERFDYDDEFEDWEELERALRELQEILPDLARSKDGSTNSSTSWWQSIYAAIAVVIGFFAALISFCKNFSRCIKLLQTIIEEITHVGEYLLNFKTGMKVAMERTGIRGLIDTTRKWNTRRKCTQNTESDENI